MSRKIPIGLPFSGGKAHIAEWIIGHFPVHKKYIEPFGGGASVIINKTPVSTEVYNDIDSEIVNFFNVLRHNGEKLREMLDLTPYAREELDDAMIYDENDSDLERARKTVVKTMFSFNGRGFRAVANNNTSAPKRFRNYIDGLNFVINRFKNITIENRDVFELLKVHDSKETLFYLDPPYLGTNNYEYNFSEKQHKQLAEYVKELNGFVIISGYAHNLYDEIYPKELFRRVEKKVNVGSIKKSSIRTECLWISRNVPCGLFDIMGGVVDETQNTKYFQNLLQIRRMLYFKCYPKMFALGG